MNNRRVEKLTEEKFPNVVQGAGDEVWWRRGCG